MENEKHGARIYQFENKLLVKQTVLRGNPSEYVIDSDAEGTPKEVHVKPDDDAAIASAVRAALAGKLKGKGSAKRIARFK